jgi:hypothetical protein
MISLFSIVMPSVISGDFVSDNAQWSGNIRVH